MDQPIFTLHDDERVTVDQWTPTLRMSTTMLWPGWYAKTVIRFSGELTVETDNGKATYRFESADREGVLNFVLVSGEVHP